MSPRATSTRRWPPPTRASRPWRKVSAFERGKILRKAADLVRARADEIAKVLTQEQGKVLAEAKMEVLSAADIIDWFAGEGPARLRPHHPGPRRRRAQHGDHGADRPGGRLLALELPRHAGRAQDRGVAGGGLLDHHQVPRGDAGLARSASSSASTTPACRRA